MCEHCHDRSVDVEIPITKFPFICLFHCLYFQVDLPLHIEPSLEADGDSSSTLSSSRWRTPFRQGAVVLVGRLWVRSTFAVVQLRKLGQEKLKQIERRQRQVNNHASSCIQCCMRYKHKPSLDYNNATKTNLVKKRTLHHINNNKNN